eukprot:TRINITY_DN9202_c0_g1_i13.p1 TRINITY_DN9202_c0_g1~~TRINITY_DN9202_c0_g1_i13.p1  ORF type:complete len:234 (-),score=41.83 TRINITY_DN9202_c0_g1_i13:896-1597(-)
MCIRDRFIAICASCGFTFHHAKGSIAMMTLWLPKYEENRIPSFATHYIGVGGIVIRDDTEEILVIKERKSRFAADLWKIPGGLVEQNEYIKEGAVREVREETGIESEFVGLLAFREKLNYLFGHPDLYFVALLKPLTTELKPDPREVKEARWMPVQEFVDQPVLIETQRKIAYLALAKLRNQQPMTDIEKECMLDLVIWKAEHFQMKLGKKPSDNVFYAPGALHIPRKEEPKL